MIELPEAVTIARQLAESLTGKRIAAAMRGNSPHQFAFYSGAPELYESALPGKVLGLACAQGNLIVVPAEPGFVLGLGVGGERILYHADASTLPRKHQLWLRFEDDSHLTVSVSGWGAAWLVPQSDVAEHRHMGEVGVDPLGPGFTWERWQALFAGLPAGDSRLIKFFMISDPRVWGLGNGCLQDILFQARLHPRRRAGSLTVDEQRALFDATRDVLAQMVALGGRDSEHDLFGRPGGYRRILSSVMTGQPCPRCGAPIARIALLGGASYFCPQCQT